MGPVPVHWSSIPALQLMECPKNSACWEHATPECARHHSGLLCTSRLVEIMSAFQLRTCRQVSNWRIDCTHFSIPRSTEKHTTAPREQLCTLHPSA